MLINPDHDPAPLDQRAGLTVDKVDQLSSMMLLGIAVVGAVGVTIAHLVVG